jgi:hypothetical protein
MLPNMVKTQITRENFQWRQLSEEFQGKIVDKICLRETKTNDKAKVSNYRQKSA